MESSFIVVSISSHKNWTLKDITYRRANDQRRLHDSPKCKVSPVFFDGKISITNLQHVRVGVTPEIGVVQQEDVLIGNLRNTGPIR